MFLGAQADAPENLKNPLAGSAAAVAAGAKLYTQACQVCHGGGARGDRAPALNGALRRGEKDGEIFLNIRAGVRGTQMPAFAQFSSDQTWQLVAYLRSLSGAPGDAPAAPTVAGDATAGARVFAAQCAGCHAVNGAGGVVGPNLTDTGRLSAEAIRRKILDPQTTASAPAVRRRGGPSRPQTLVARLQDGREIRGVRRNEDTFSVQMMDASGHLHLFEKSRLAGFRVENRSLMPAPQHLAAGDVDNLVAYLKAPRARMDAVPAPAAGGVSYARLRNADAEPHNWMMYWGNFAGTHFSKLNQITPANVRTLQAQWSLQLLGDQALQTTPLVIDGVMYTSGPPGQVYALDARTGRQIWRYERRMKSTHAYAINQSNRGVAVLDNRVFFGTLDAALVALDARTGQFLWEAQLADVQLGHSLTSPPLAVDGKIITGISGGEFPIRGFIDAYDPATGQRLWRFYTIPGPGEPGNETWLGDSWKEGGSATWLTGTYDPATNLVYWPTGNPAPAINGDVRRGDNLYSASVVALNAGTGKLAWHYQFTPNDTHDWDSTEDVMLVDRMFKGQMRKLLLHGDRNGFLYALDRVTGQFLGANAFAKQNWNKGFDDKGRPMPVDRSRASADGSIEIYPSMGGATNYQAPSYDPATGWFIMAYAESAQRYIATPVTSEPGRQYQGGRTERVDVPARAGIKAVDPETGETKWDFPLIQGSLTNGVLATAGGVTFAASADGNFIALDSKTGKALWKFQTGGAMAASPISYAIDGRQHVAIASGNVLYSFALPE
ncbi:MAG: PQQ-dependent dehydrogenase, methanol/ethanol family [Bryobacterales bacterium]|nr:PQQ-dependent dehydrogenase, methanol/ethanol family [Bryobacterales bacterium]